MQIAYALDIHGAGADWNVIKVFATASAEGGSELADMSLDAVAGLYGFWSFGIGAAIALSELCGEDTDDYSVFLPVQDAFALDCDLTVSAARGKYDHDNTQGVPFVHAASFSSTGYDFVFEGLADGAVPLHSACACAQPVALNTCTCEPWDNHTVEFTDVPRFGLTHWEMRRGTRCDSPWARWQGQVRHLVNNPAPTSASLSSWKPPWWPHRELEPDGHLYAPLCDIADGYPYPFAYPEGRPMIDLGVVPTHDWSAP